MLDEFTTWFEALPPEKEVSAEEQERCRRYARLAWEERERHRMADAQQTASALKLTVMAAID